MSLVWGRLAALTITCLAFAAGQVSSPIQEPPSNSATSSALAVVQDTVYEDNANEKTWTNPILGTRALRGVPARILDLGKRECLANGSNYCFGNDVDYCPGCGNCCFGGDYCCGIGKICCGAGCCSSDQTCSEGKCLSSM